VTAQRLDRVLTCYRIGDPDGLYPIFDGRGAELVPGRWNEPGQTVIYACEHYSTAMLEKLARGRGSLPRNQHYITITVPSGSSYEVVGRDHLPGWDTAEPTVSRAHGGAWAAARRSLLLLALSYVARIERNVVINPAHREFSQITTSLHEPVWWDERLF
jgi:RES domain-containing protein